MFKLMNNLNNAEIDSMLRPIQLSISKHKSNPHAKWKNPRANFIWKSTWNAKVSRRRF